VGIRAVGKRLIIDNRGSVESSMVLIPLIFLFLIATQISIAIHARNLDNAYAQSAASVRAISGEFQEDDMFLPIDSPDSHQNLELLITRKERTLPQLVPGLSRILGRDSKIEVSGIAIIENQR
jgi:hypothetical protein